MEPIPNMPAPIKNGDDISNSIIYVLSSYNRMIRAVVLIGILVLILVGLLTFFIKRFMENDVKVEYNQNGLSFVLAAKNPFSGDKNFKAIYLLPSSSVWNNTGIRIPKGQKIRISANGQVNLAIHHVVKAAEEDTIPKTNWVNPNGTNWKIIHPDDKFRKQLLLLPEENIGKLIGCLCAYNETTPPVDSISRINFISIGSEKEIQNDTGHDCILWLAVNDILLDKNNLELSRDAYCGSMVTDKEKKIWQGIQQNQFWDIFYMDNVGNYLVQIESVN